MLFRLCTHSKRGIYIFILLVLSSFLVPRNVFNYNYFWFTLFVIVIPVAIMWYTLKYLKRENNLEYERIPYDFLVFDLLYMLALPTYYLVLVYRISNQQIILWEENIITIVYFSFIGIVVFLKLLSINNRHAGITRFSILFLFPMLNLIAINQVMTLWYQTNFGSRIFDYVW